MQKLSLPKRALSLVLVLVLLVAAALPVIGMVDMVAGQWKLSSDTEIFVVSDEPLDDAMTAQVKLFASELAEKVTKTALPISCGSIEEAGANDIILVLDDTADIAAEGFVTKKNGNAMTITASDADGLFYGCRFVIKELAYDSTVSNATEAPAVAERTLSLDNGRKYYSVEWIKGMIRELSWANMNTLALHFSEEMGLGIESKLYPWLNGRDGTLCTQNELDEDYDNRYLTQEEIKEIVEYAKLYHVEIIPSFDSPGHMNYIVKKFNEKCANTSYSFTYDGKTYTAARGSKIGNYYHYWGLTSIVQGSRNTAYSRGIDISNEVAVAFTRSLVEEYGKLFAELGCTKFDIGGDELLGWGSAAVSTSIASRWKQLDHWKTYAQNRAKAEGKSNYSNAVAYDAFLYYMNDMNELVRSLGYTSVRMWNDDALRTSDTGWKQVVKLDTDIDIWYWQPSTNDVNEYTDAGYNVYNLLNQYCYYAMTPGYYAGSSYADARANKIYNNWTPYNFGNGGTLNSDQVLGGGFAIWSDQPDLRTEDKIKTAVVPMIRSIGEKSWNPNANKSVTFSQFESYFAGIGDAPAGTVAAGDVYYVADVTALQMAVDAYASVDASLYTEDSFTVYAAAVNAGKNLLNMSKPEQADVDDATATINNAKAALELKPDTTALESAIAEFEQTDESLYTEASYQNYATAAAEAKNLLNGDYTQAQVDAATEKLNDAKTALTIRVNTDELEKALAEYAAVKTEATKYTAESLADYETAAEAAEALLADDNCTQAEINAAVDALNAAKTALIEAQIRDIECIMQGAFQTKTVSRGKLATLGVSTYKEVGVAGIVVYDDQGDVVEAYRYTINTRQSNRDVHTFIFRVNAADRGDRTYTVYAVLEDGTRSADCLTLTLTVR